MHLGPPRHEKPILCTAHLVVECVGLSKRQPKQERESLGRSLPDNRHADSAR